MSVIGAWLKDELLSQKRRALAMEWDSEDVSDGSRQRFCVSEEALTWKLLTRPQLDQEWSNLPGDMEDEEVLKNVLSQHGTVGAVRGKR